MEGPANFSGNDVVNLGETDRASDRNSGACQIGHDPLFARVDVEAVAAGEAKERDNRHDLCKGSLRTIDNQEPTTYYRATGTPN